MFMDASIFLFLMFGFLLLWNTPIAVGLAMASLLTMFLNDAPMAVFPLTMYSATAKFASWRYPSSSWPAWSWKRPAFPVG